MDEAQHDQHKRKSEEEHAFNRGNGKVWHEQEYSAGFPTGQMEDDTPSAVLGLTPSEIPLHIESNSPSSLYSNVVLSNEEDFAGEHLDTDAARDAQELADAGQFGPLPQTGGTFSVGNHHIPSDDHPESCVRVTGPDRIVKFYCVVPACFPETAPFASVEEYRQHEVVHMPATTMQSQQPTILTAMSVATSGVSEGALRPDLSAPTVPMIHDTATPASSQMSPASLATSPVDLNELKLLELVADYPMRYTQEVENGVLVRVYHCGVAQCRYSDTFKTEKLARKHQRCHIPDEHLPCPCDYDACTRRFLYPSHLLRHQREMHLGVKYQCTQCEYSSSKYSNVYGKRRHFEKRHPGRNKPEQDDVKVVPEARAQTSTGPSQPMPASLPPHTPRPDTAPRRQPAHSPRTPGAPGRFQAPPPQFRHHQVEYHAIPADNVTHAALANSYLRSPFGPSHTPSGSSSSRKSSVATPLSCYSSQTMSHQPSDGFSSRISQASTAPTSISTRSGGRALYSDAARRAPRSPASPSTPTRASRGIAPASATTTPPRGQSSRYTYGGGSFDIPIRAARSDHCFGGPGSRKRS
ncbi:hypothetical protein LTR56_025440 [Elasticomyces elasticus]|nr:hypothetical protein LTR56_025440 [Elasticomyces elasticus]KAK3652010.1 hypothetical protein LTR22_011940 [Elasticomyces elasticus]KAK4919038.1 hypothetical protein LTR49_013209 [Elasticomyces elasticus]KAK5738989.1 hypothetical protein LTS12_025423 [Elasticomyces elasticus]